MFVAGLCAIFLKKSLNCNPSTDCEIQKKMKTTILLFAVIFGYITPTYSQLNRHHQKGARTEQFQIKKNDDFGNYKFADKFSDAWSARAQDSFNLLPTRPGTIKLTKEIYSGDDMPCFQPKSGDYMPCIKPDGLFSMRVYKPESVIWGILWAPNAVY